MAADLELSSWPLEELEALDSLLGKVADLPVPGPGRASTLLMAQSVTGQILTYQRELLRLWNRTGRALAEAAGMAADGRSGGRAQAEGLGRRILEQGVEDFAAAADRRFRQAFQTGVRLAARFRERIRLAESEQERLVVGQLRRNEHYVRESLFSDLRSDFSEALSEPKPDEAVAEAAAGYEWRVGMYATKLWGVAHLGFAAAFLGLGGLSAVKEPAVVRGKLRVDEPMLRWVTTSLEPCPDCVRLAKQGPYYPGLNPLPTAPGLGDTRCRTNCLCLLVEVPPIGGGLLEAGATQTAGRVLPPVVDDAELEDVPRFSPQQQKRQREQLRPLVQEVLQDEPQTARVMDQAWGGWFLAGETPHGELIKQRIAAMVPGTRQVYPRPDISQEMAERGRGTIAETVGVATEQVDQMIDRGLRLTYQLTQAALRRAGKETLTLYRGVVLPRVVRRPDGGQIRLVFEEAQEYTLEHNPVSSWTTDPAVARRFARGAGPGSNGYVLEAQVKAEEILATTPVMDAFLSESQLGTLRGSQEMVVFGRPGLTARVVQVFEGRGFRADVFEGREPVRRKAGQPGGVLPVEGPENSHWLRRVSEQEDGGDER